MLLSVTGLFLLSCPLACLFCHRAGLDVRVTDSGLRALASAGCGEKLTSLTLSSECCCVLVCDLMVCGSGRWSVLAGCVMLVETGALSPLLSSFLFALADAQVWE